MDVKEKAYLLIALIVIACVWVVVCGIGPEDPQSNATSDGFIPFKVKQLQITDADIIDTAKKAVVVISGPMAEKELPVEEPAAISDAVTVVINDEPQAVVPTEQTSERALESVRAVMQIAKADKAAKNTYQVKQGDNLGKIAIKIYGDKDVLANIDKIYNANKDRLKNKNSLKVGQELEIPSVDADTGSALKRFAGQNKDLLEFQPSSKVVPEMRYYVVKDGDSLWKIAKSQLGSGKRYDEIVELNKKLSKTRSLQPGARIVLPNA
ncbi:MAG: LysM peptidoglycan-binding domain-containing protein [Phycisphaerae bacterium]|jgi:nucleoid-associated protein YgaU